MTLGDFIRYVNVEIVKCFLKNIFIIIDKTISIPEIQFMFLKPWIRSQHQSPSLDMYFQEAGSGAVHVRLGNQNHLKFTDPQPRLTLVLVVRNRSRNRNHWGILLEDGVKVARNRDTYLSRRRIRVTICKPPIRSRHRSPDRSALVQTPSMIEDLPSFHISFLSNEATNYIPASSLQRKR